jgi:murein L,D-transpeptidase YcbB/YkuD
MKLIIGLTFILMTAMASRADELSEAIRQFIGNKPTNSCYEIDKEYLIPGNVLMMFYLNRMYTPAWINRITPGWIRQNAQAWSSPFAPDRIIQSGSVWAVRNVVDRNAYELLDYIRQSDRHGLQPKDFHLALIEKYIRKILSQMPMDTMDSEDMMKLDVLLTDAFMLLGTQLYYGKVDPLKEEADWNMQRKDPMLRLDLKLEEALAASDPANSLDQLAPDNRSYWKMKNELAYYLKLKEQSWPAILSDVTVKPGELNPIIPKIRERLIKLRYQLSDSTSMKYDEELEKQLKLFQNDWGLNSDSIIGKGTLEVLNSKPEKLIDQLKVNMERFRWLPPQVTGKYIIVNIANFELDLIDRTDTLVSMRVIVGKNYRKTPVFNARMTYIVFSPKWTVPPTILQNDVIPELLKGPAYLKKKNMHLLRPDGSEIAYSDIDWSKISKNRFPFMVRQNPGPGNSLGKVKFMFPNSYDVYIHDTPTKGSFAVNDRALSSGCIRAEKPYELALLLLSDVPEWSPFRILTAMQQVNEQKVFLKTPVDVVVIYLTAWTDGNSRIQFRKDVYERDGMVLKALNKRPQEVIV